MTSRKVLIAAALAAAVTVPASLYLGVQLYQTPAQAAGDGDGEGTGADGEAAEAKKKPYENLKLKNFLIPVISNGRTQSYLSMRVRIQVRPGKPSADDKRAALRDAVITRLYDLDAKFSLNRKDDVERIRKAVHGAAVDVLGHERVGEVFFNNLVQQDVGA
jgi:hypothetical protein